MAWLEDEYVLLRETISGTVKKFIKVDAAALLAYPGTVWAKVEEEAKQEIHEAAEDVADWSAPATEAAAEAAAEPTPAPTPIEYS